MTDDLDTLLAGQGGVATAAQLLGWLGRAGFESLVARGELVAVWTGVYAHTEPDLLLQLHGSTGSSSADSQLGECASFKRPVRATASRPVMSYNVATMTTKAVTGMAADAVVRARIDGDIKEEAAAIYQAMGLTISDAVRMMLVRTVADRTLPFDPLVPNETSIEAMKAARRGETTAVDGVDALVADLHADA